MMLLDTALQGGCGTAVTCAVKALTHDMSSAEEGRKQVRVLANQLSTSSSWALRKSCRPEYDQLNIRLGCIVIAKDATAQMLNHGLEV